MFGRVHEVDGHYIVTRFVALAIPVECLYVSNKTPRTSVVGATSNGVRIQTQWQSVLLGYVRLWLPIFAFGLPLVEIALVGGPAGVQVLTWVLSALLLATVMVTHRLGRLPEEEKARLRLLGTVTGFRIDPSMLQPSTRAVKRDSLGELMTKGGIPTSAEGILAVLDDIPLPAMPLVYGYACYSGDDPVWRTCAARVYERCLDGDW